jgi:Uma2 family endonuclease
MSAQQGHRYTVADYLNFERGSDRRHEYWQGQILAMAGSSPAHNLIAGQWVTQLNNALQDRPCRVFNDNLRVAIPKRDGYFYPDVTVVCGEPQFDDDQRDQLTNPQVIVEVLSPSTEMFDRNVKLRLYQSLPSVEAILYVSQDRPRVEIWLRGADGTWLPPTEVTSVETPLPIPPLGCMIDPGRVYRFVTFGNPASL